jgi:hypothetical protein
MSHFECTNESTLSTCASAKGPSASGTMGWGGPPRSCSLMCFILGQDTIERDNKTGLTSGRGLEARVGWGGKGGEGSRKARARGKGAS